MNRDELTALADFDHRCSDEECVNFGQRTFSNNCKCHKTREQMMLEEIRSLRTLASRQAEPVALAQRGGKSSDGDVGCGSYRCAKYGCFGYCEETPSPSDTRPADVTVYEPRCDCGHLFEICDAPNCNSALLDTYKIGAR